MKRRETVAEFKDRSDFNAIYFTLVLSGINSSTRGFEKLITRFKTVREVAIAYNFTLRQHHIDEFHKKKKSG